MSKRNRIITAKQN